MSTAPLRALAASALLVFSACSVNQLSARVAPGATLNGLHRFHVVPLKGDMLHVNDLISERLIGMGYQATSGTREDMPPATDTLVTYTYQRAWDMSMYMLTLTITFEKAPGGGMLATGTALHSSLSRRTPAQMVSEVLGEIFKKGG